MSTTPSVPAAAVSPGPLVLQQTLLHLQQVLLCMMDWQPTSLLPTIATLKEKKTVEESTVFSQCQLSLILDVIKEKLPFGSTGWEKVAKKVNTAAVMKEAKHVQSTNTIWSKFQLMIKMQNLKLTGSG